MPGARTKTGENRLPRQSILFVCLGNICRSPLAEGVFRHRLGLKGLANRVEIQSAGLGGWHVGHAPDPRAIRAAAGKGYDISRQRARQVAPADFARFDLILGMDRSNVAALAASRPASARAEIGLYLHHALGRFEDVSDPYYGGDGGFHHVVSLIEDASDALVEKLLA